MPDEHDNDPGHEGPRRPSNARGPAFRTEHPGPDGNTIQDQRRMVTAPERDARHTSPPDPRFADAPMSLAEMQALYDARDLDTACRLLGQFQEARMKDGRLPQAPSHGPALEAVIAHMSLDEQIARGLRPTPGQLSHIQSARTPDDQKNRAENFLAERALQNKEWFHRSRLWGPELARQADAGQQHDQRTTGPRGTQAWRSDLAELRKAAYRASSHELTDTGPPQPLSADPRFAKAPLTPAETLKLHQASTPEALNQLLGHMHEARVKDGHLPPALGLHAEKALINQALTPQEQIRLGLKPTAQELTSMQTNALQGQEFRRAMQFIARRHAQNDRWFDETRENASQQTARDYWKQRSQNSTAAALRDARTEKGERRSDVQQLKATLQQRREQNAVRDGKDAEHGRDQGGRER